MFPSGQQSTYRTSHVNGLFTRTGELLRVATNVDGHVLLEEIPKVTAEIPKFEEDEQDQEDADEVMDQDPNDSDDDSVAGSEENDSG